MSYQQTHQGQKLSQQEAELEHYEACTYLLEACGHVLIVVWQQDDHAESIVLVGKLKYTELEVLIVAHRKFVLLMHHHHLLYFFLNGNENNHSLATLEFSGTAESCVY